MSIVQLPKSRKNNKLTGREKNLWQMTPVVSGGMDETTPCSMYHLLFPHCSNGSSKSRAIHLKKSDVNFYEISERAAASKVKKASGWCAVFL